MAIPINIFTQESHTNVIEFAEEDPDVVRAALRLLYGMNYTNEHDPLSNIFHLKMYLFTDKYTVSSLQEVALNNLESALQNTWDAKDLPETIRLVYEAAPVELNELRDIVLKRAMTRAKELLKNVTNSDFEKILDKVREFSRDVAKKLLLEKAPSKLVSCTKR